MRSQRPPIGFTICDCRLPVSIKNRKSKIGNQLKNLLHGKYLVIALLLIVGCVTPRNRDSALADSSIAPAELRCEYLQEPLGIDVKRPRLSWKLEAANADQRGQAQTAYRILVASSEELLAGDEGDLWDSGEVKSGQSQLVDYGGSALSSGMRCYWKVQVRDEGQALSVWSKPVRWSMGVLKTRDSHLLMAGDSTQK